MPHPASATHSLARLLEVHRNGDSGPRASPDRSTARDPHHLGVDLNHRASPPTSPPHLATLKALTGPHSRIPRGRPHNRHARPTRARRHTRERARKQGGREKKRKKREKKRGLARALIRRRRGTRSRTRAARRTRPPRRRPCGGALAAAVAERPRASSADCRPRAKLWTPRAFQVALL